MLELDWKTILEESVKSYNDNELAFLALQGKIELQLRDKIAWYLEKQLGKEYWVRKEYRLNGQSKCDLAILDKNTKLPIFLIEFKAHSSAKFENHYANKECVNDCKKMVEFAEEKDIDPEMFFVFFQTYHKGMLNEEYQHLITYYDTVSKGIGEVVDKDWNQFDNYGKRQERVDIVAGECYDLDVKIATMVLKVDKEKVS